MWTGDMPLMKLLLYQLERLMQIFVPEVYNVLILKEIPYEMFSIQWYLSLFSYDFDFDHLKKLWDLFLVLRWKFLLQLSIVILKKMQKSVEELSFRKLAEYVKSALNHNLISTVSSFYIQ